MLNSEPAALLVTVLLFVAGLAVTFFIGTELIRIVRDFFTHMRGSGLPQGNIQPQVNAQQAAARRNRATVERLINKFEEGSDSRSAASKD